MRVRISEDSFYPNFTIKPCPGEGDSGYQHYDYSVNLPKDVVVAYQKAEAEFMRAREALVAAIDASKEDEP